MSMFSLLSQTGLSRNSAKCLGFMSLGGERSPFLFFLCVNPQFLTLVKQQHKSKCSVKIVFIMQEYSSLCEYTSPKGMSKLLTVVEALEALVSRLKICLRHFLNLRYVCMYFITVLYFKWMSLFLIEKLMLVQPFKHKICLNLNAEITQYFFLDYDWMCVICGFLFY